MIVDGVGQGNKKGGIMLFNLREIERRIEELRQRLSDSGFDGDVVIIHHLADIFYFTGTVQDGYLLIGRDGEPVFALKRNLDRAGRETPLRHLVRLSRNDDIARLTNDLCGGRPKCVGAALDVMTVSTYSNLSKIFPDVSIRDVSLHIRIQRTVKSQEELELMKGAAGLALAVYEKAHNVIVPGMTDWELSATLEYEARLKGNLEIIRVRNRRLEILFGHILSGPEASLPSYGDTPTGGAGVSPAFPQGPTIRHIKEHDIVSVDTMLNYHGYLNDQTRNFSIGSPPDRLKAAFDLSLELHRFFRCHAVPGTVSGELYDQMINIVGKTPFAPYFMGYGQDKVSFIGHGIGIEVDELPFIARNQKGILQSGMTVALEPKFIIPNEGMVGIENTYVISENGAISLNLSPEELVIL